MKYKLGDKVRMVNNDITGKWGVLFEKCKGKIGTITSIASHCYIIDHNLYHINFTDRMLEPAEINWKERLTK